jgi:SdpC family antimicrobial peptide
MLSLISVNSNFSVSAETSEEGYTGEVVFRGVFFGEGEVADLFPEIWGNYKSQVNSKEWIKLKESIISSLKTNNPTFLDKFGKEMQSGNHFRIQSILIEGSNLLRNLGFDNKMSEKSAVENTITITERVLDVDIIKQTLVVVDIAFMVTPENVDGSSKLYRDIFINLIADKLEIKN